ncbi:hypothetical protein M8C21_019621 [Ambrosia artemisiifolia]|uniref:RING-type domain-containing protein n=1 Tax=Ambrosia artemisiifolia TaxID=4212 RepID=A0AAD5CMW8_AMBAR|nr:hypothetical protein M8C21_019621 [Ambrosia artemisiifolia]
MTSASELFHSRRYHHHNHRSALLPHDSSLPSSSSSPPSSSSYQHLRHNNRRDACSRRIHRRHLEHHQPLNPEEGDSHSPSPSGCINSHARRSIHRSIGTANDRLPGSVLLARERLVQRLTGLSVSGNRLSSGSSSTTHQNDYSTHNVLELRNNTRAEMVSESWQETRRNHPVGLNEDELKCLQLESFSSESCRKSDESLSASTECTICLEGFQDGDKIICLLCTHRFHSCCLFPWVRVCGACPNCRKPILVNAPVK